MKTVFPVEQTRIKSIVELTKGEVIRRDGREGVRYSSYNKCNFFFPCFVEDGTTIGFNFPTSITFLNKIIYETIRVPYTETSYSAFWTLLKEWK